MEDFLNKAIELLTAMSATATDTQVEELQELLNAVHLHRTNEKEDEEFFLHQLQHSICSNNKP